jgi:hypothetical protein
MTRLRTVVAVHGVTAGGNAANTGYGQVLSKAVKKFSDGRGKSLGSFDVPVVEALWADEAQRFVSTDSLVNAQALVLRALGGPVAAAIPNLLTWFGVPDLATIADLVADGASVLGCSTLRGSRIWGRGSGPIETFEQAASVLSFEPGVLLRAPGRDGLATELGATLVVPIRRPRFVIEENGARLDLFQPARLGAAVKLALGYEF